VVVLAYEILGARCISEDVVSGGQVEGSQRGKPQQRSGDKVPRSWR